MLSVFADLFRRYQCHKLAIAFLMDNGQLTMDNYQLSIGDRPLSPPQTRSPLKPIVTFN